MHAQRKADTQRRPGLQFDFTPEEVRALHARVAPYPQLRMLGLSCELAFAGYASVEDCTRLQAAITALRGAGG